ncbi:MAG: PEP-CTERM sorting domain-containing protein [Gammaproteobacteria bacterium]
MNIFKKPFVALAFAAGMMSFAVTTNAIPISADIMNFSVMHLGSNPAGTGSTDDWFNFDAGQSINLDLDLNANTLELIAPQSFSMSTNNGATDVLQLLGFSMDLNDSDGFLGGTINYIMNGNPGQFLFADENYTTLYNTSSFENGVFSLAIWGGDEINDLGLDLGLTAQVPEPGVLVLMLTGLAAFRLSKRLS